jgi:hypothetical protein
VETLIDPLFKPRGGTNAKPTPPSVGFAILCCLVESRGSRSRESSDYSRSDPLELPELPEPDDLPELDDCPEAGLCGEIWPLPVPVLPALVYWLLPVPGPPAWLRNLSSVRPTPVPGMAEPLCCVVDWLPLV